MTNKAAASTASSDYVKFQAVIKSAASAASLNYVKFQAVIKSAARAASSGGRASGRLEHGFLFAILGRASGLKIVETSYT